MLHRIHPDYTMARGRHDGVSSPKSKFRRGRERQATIAAEVDHCRVRIDADRRIRHSMSFLIPMSEPQARAVFGLIEQEGRRRDELALANGEPRPASVIELKKIAAQIIQVFPSLREEYIAAGLKIAGQRCATNIGAAAECDLAANAYLRECVKRGIETAAKRVRRQRQEERR